MYWWNAASARTGTTTPFGVPVVPEVKSMTMPASGPVTAAGRPGSCAATMVSRSRSPSRDSGQSARPATTTGTDVDSSLPRWSASETITFASPPVMRISMAGHANAVNSGMWTAPSRQIPISVNTRSADFDMSVATRSPSATPSAARAAAIFSLSVRSSP